MLGQAAVLYMGSVAFPKSSKLVPGDIGSQTEVLNSDQIQLLNPSGDSVHLH